VELQTLNHRHDAIAEWLAMNGDKSLGECAREFNYTLPWLSQLVHSNLFQARYQEMCRERGEAALHSLGAKMSRAAHMALDRTIERLENGGGASDQFVTNAREKLLEKLGYAGEAGEVHQHQHQHVHVTSEDLENARDAARLSND